MNVYFIFVLRSLIVTSQDLGASTILFLSPVMNVLYIIMTNDSERKCTKGSVQQNYNTHFFLHLFVKVGSILLIYGFIVHFKWAADPSTIDAQCGEAVKRPITKTNSCFL